MVGGTGGQARWGLGVNRVFLYWRADAATLGRRLEDLIGRDGSGHPRYDCRIQEYTIDPKAHPVRARIVDRPEEFRWSSDRFYRRGLAQPWLDVDIALGKLAQQREEALSTYRRLMANRDEQSYDDVPTYGVAIKGDRDFAERTFILVGEPRRLPSSWTPESLAESVAEAGGLSFEELRKPRRSMRESRIRLIAAYLGQREAGFSIARMAKCFDREESTFNRGVRRLEDLISKDESVRADVERLASCIRLRNTGIHD